MAVKTKGAIPGMPRGPLKGTKKYENVNRRLHVALDFGTMGPKILINAFFTGSCPKPAISAPNAMLSRII
jgi:hypothetical protein